MNFNYGTQPREMIHGYQLEMPLTTQNAGMSRWSFAVRNGQEYFIKQFLSPKYPAMDGKLSPELVQSMRRIADRFYAQKKRFYDKLREIRTGNVIVILDFFREGSFYYITTERVHGPYMSIEAVSTLDQERKRVLLKSILYSISQIHGRGIVHADLKPDNILIRQTSGGFCTAKIIDFEASFFANEAPEQVEGDQVYFSPEAVLRNNDEPAQITPKADVFALGVLFHQYLSGRLPDFDSTRYNYISEAVLDGSAIHLDPGISPDMQQILMQMLNRDSAKRPSALELWQALKGTTQPVQPVNPFGGQVVPGSQGGSRGFAGWYAASDDDL